MKLVKVEEENVKRTKVKERTEKGETMGKAVMLKLSLCLI
jgi:hypothetical protein